MGQGRYYGWTIAWALGVTQTIGFGVLYYAYAVFVTPMEAELGLSRVQTGGAFSLALLVSGLAAPAAGRWVDLWGARGLMTLGSSLGALLVLAWSFIAVPWQLYAVQAGLGLVMAAVLYDVAFTVVAVWFRDARTRAMLLVTLVAGLASTIFIPLATWLELQYGWREALRALALILALGTAPLHALALRRRPEDLGLSPDGLGAAARPTSPQRRVSVTARAALRAAPFWWLALAFALARVSVVAVAAHAVPLLLERGHAPALVAASLGSVGLWQLAGRLLYAPAERGLSSRHLAALTFGLQGLGMLCLLASGSALMVWAFAALFGVSNGALTLSRATLVAERFGAAHYGSVNGSMALLIALVQTVAPLGAGLLYGLTSSYVPVVWTLAACGALAALSVLRLGGAHDD